MAHTINEMHADVTDLKRKIDGDGNGVRGLVRRTDHVESRQDSIDRFMTRIEKLFWAIMTAIILSMIITLLQKTYGPAPSQHVNQSISTIPSDGDPAAPTYTTPQMARLLQVSDREVQDRASKGEIPGAWRDGKAWRFDRPSVDSWLTANAATAATAANSADAARDQQ